MSEKVILCDICKGFGHTRHSKMLDYHTGERDEYYLTCENCQGTGRMVELSAIVKLSDAEKRIAFYHKVKET